jgi:hypothetical protein
LSEFRNPMNEPEQTAPRAADLEQRLPILSSSLRTDAYEHCVRACIGFFLSAIGMTIAALFQPRNWLAVAGVWWVAGVIIMACRIFIRQASGKSASRWFRLLTDCFLVVAWLFILFVLGYWGAWSMLHTVDGFAFAPSWKNSLFLLSGVCGLSAFANIRKMQLKIAHVIRSAEVDEASHSVNRLEA